jgi:hypothetical protein
MATYITLMNFTAQLATSRKREASGGSQEGSDASWSGDKGGPLTHGKYDGRGDRPQVATMRRGSVATFRTGRVPEPFLASRAVMLSARCRRIG